MTGLDRLARRIGVVWTGFVVVLGLVAWSDVNDDARALVMTATVLAVLASLTTVVAVERGRPVLAGIALIVAGLAAPTFAAVWFDLVPVGVGIAVLVRAGRQRRTVVAHP